VAAVRFGPVFSGIWLNLELDQRFGSSSCLNLEPDLAEPVPPVRFKVQGVLNQNRTANNNIIILKKV
jgi:hypothetical protein